MSRLSENKIRKIEALHGLKEVKPDPEFEIDLAEYLRVQYDQKGLKDLYARFINGNSNFDTLMRRAIWRAATRQFGQSVVISSGVEFKHLETVEIGNNVFIGAQTYIQGWFDGNCVIGNHVWIGPQSYFDARYLIIEDYVGWGPGAKVLGSNHTGVPINIPIIQTQLEIKPVRVKAGADIGMGAIILPGITIGEGSIVGAGAVVTKDMPPFAVVVGVPARFLRWREGYVPEEEVSKKKNAK
jgi:acetyltransferase-like isoleucine patch superfamily enzyme